LFVEDLSNGRAGDTSELAVPLRRDALGRANLPVRKLWKMLAGREGRFIRRVRELAAAAPPTTLVALVPESGWSAETGRGLGV